MGKIISRGTNRKFKVGDKVSFMAGAFEKTKRSGRVRFLEANGMYTVISNGQNYTIHGKSLKRRR